MLSEDEYGYENKRGKRPHGGRNVCTNRGELPEVNSIHQGTIKTLKEFGAFVTIDGFKRDGLVHVSNISEKRVEKPEDVLSSGECVWVKVTKVDDDGKIGLDMRYVDQCDGSDLDPTGEKTQKRRDYGRGPAPIQLDAIYDTKCTRCGGTGHVSHECFNTSGSKYTMMSVDEGANGPRGSVKAPPPGFATGSNSVGLGTLATHKVTALIDSSVIKTIRKEKKLKKEKKSRMKDKEKEKKSRMKDKEKRKRKEKKHKHKTDRKG